MLFNLKNKNKNSFKIKPSIFGGLSVSPFDPLTYDNNTIALWDADDINAPNWLDQVSGQNMLLSNNPTITPNALNTHKIITFDGIDDFARCQTPVSLPFTLYFVLNPKSYVANRYLFDDGVTTVANATRYQGGTPNFNYVNNAVSVGTFAFNSFGLNNFKVLSLGVASGDNNSWYLINNGVYTAWGIGNRVAIKGLTLGSAIGGFASGNVAYAYIIIRKIKDSQATADLFINYLRARFNI